MPVHDKMPVDTEMAWIDDKEIQVWIEPYRPSKEPGDRMMSVLSPAEIQRANAYYFHEDRKRYVQAHVLLRLILSEYAGMQPQEIVYRIGAHGKPHLMPENPVCFNLSHTKEMIAVAISSERNVGIDIEKKADIADIDCVARQFMSRDECLTLRGMTADAKRDYFYQCWVQKEALIKASGRGIDDNLRVYSVMDGNRRAGAKTIFTCVDETPNTWWLSLFEHEPDHIGAVCIESSDPQAYSIKIVCEDVLAGY